MRAKDFERQGLLPDAARDRARQHFGDVEKYRGEMMRIKTDQVERVEKTGYWDEFRQDINFSLRQLLRKPALPLFIVVLLAIGIGANTAIFSVVKAVILEPLLYPSADRLTMVWETRKQSSYIPASYLNFKDWKSQSESFEGLAAFTPWRFNLTGEGEAEQVLGGVVSAGFFEVLGVQPQLGRGILQEEHEPGAVRAVVLSHRLWQRRFGGDPDIVGRTIVIDGEASPVIGVMPPSFDYPSPWLIGERADLWMSIHTRPFMADMREHRESHWLATIGRLKNGISIETAQRDMDIIAERLAEKYPDPNEGAGIRVSRLQEELVGRAGGHLMMLLGGAGLVLLIVCGNVAGLLMAKATTRQTEVAVRSALGAGRARLLRQLLVENLPLALLGGGLGFILAVWGIALLRSSLPTDILGIDAVVFDGWVFLFTLAVSILTGILFSLAPAWATAKTDLADTLKQGRATVSMGRHRVRSLLMIAQFALTLVLANAAALMLQSYFDLRHRDFGFETDKVLIVGLAIQGPEYEDPNNFVTFFEEALDQVKRLPGVQRVAATNKLPLEGGTNNSLAEADGHDFSETDAPYAEVSVVSNEYFQTIGIPLLAGRSFTEQDHKEGRYSAVINEAMVNKLWPDKDPIGKHFSISPPHQWTVVGVVGDVSQFGAERNAIPEIYFALGSLTDEFEIFTTMVRFLVVRTELESTSLVGPIRQTVAEKDADQPISEVRTTADIVSSALSRRRFNTLLIGIFATIALILVAAGIYGVMTFFVAQRTHEIGVRFAMGARWSGVQKLVLGQGLKLAAIGTALGLAGILATTTLTESMVYGLSATDPTTLLGGIVFLVSLGLLGSLLPARRAIRVDPILALRDE
jgi:predicted permease